MTFYQSSILDMQLYCCLPISIDLNCLLYLLMLHLSKILSNARQNVLNRYLWLRYQYAQNCFQNVTKEICFQWYFIVEKFYISNAWVPKKLKSILKLLLSSCDNDKRLSPQWSSNDNLHEIKLASLNWPKFRQRTWYQISLKDWRNNEQTVLLFLKDKNGRSWWPVRIMGMKL